MTLKTFSHLNLLLISLALVAISACSKPEAANNSKSTYYHTADIIPTRYSSSYTVNTRYIGQVVTKQQTNLGFEFSGKVESILVDSGEKIQQGQVLARLNTDLLEIKATELRAQITQTKARLTLNDGNLSRIHSLMENDYSSQQKLDELTTEKQVLQASILQLQALLDTVHYQIKQAQLVAPFGGVVSKRLFAEGEMIASGSPAFQLIKNGNKEVKLGLPAKLADRLEPGEKLAMVIGQQHCQGEIISIGKQVDALNRTLEVRLALPTNISGHNGQIAQVSVENRIESPGIWLPTTALTDGIKGQWNIYQAVPQEDEMYAINAITVKVLHSTKNKVFVGLMDKEVSQVVGQGLHRYVPGQMVKKSHLLLSKQAGAEEKNTL